ncbi:MAG TPA: YciI family protein [Ignavibacteria bacterium]|jgi:uncharacterized protein YciI
MKNYYNKTLFAVTRTAGKSWDKNKTLRLQKGWDEHAAYMDQLTAEGFIVMGGPLEEPGSSLLIIDADDENEIRGKLNLDNWSKMNLLEIKDVRSWTILLQAE